jgi:hypothetical protein
MRLIRDYKENKMKPKLIPFSNIPDTLNILLLPSRCLKLSEILNE